MAKLTSGTQSLAFVILYILLTNTTVALNADSIETAADCQNIHSRKCNNVDGCWMGTYCSWQKV